MSSEEGFKFLSSAIVPTTPSERSQQSSRWLSSSSSLDAEKPKNRESASAHLLLFFISPAYSRYENRKTDELRKTKETLCFLSSAIVPTTPSERSQTVPYNFSSSSLDAEKPTKDPEALREERTQTRTKKNSRLYRYETSSLFFSRVFFFFVIRRLFPSSSFAEEFFYTLFFVPFFLLSSDGRRRKEETKKRRKKNWTKKKRSLSLGNKRIVSPFFSIIPSLSLSRL